MRLKKDNVERVAEEQAAIEKLKALGFEDMSGGQEADDNKEKKLSELNVPDLKILAKERGIEGASSLTKAELLAVLKDVD